MAHHYIGTIDHSGVLAVGDVRQREHVFAFRSLAQVRRTLADYSGGFTYTVHTLDGWHVWRSPGYGADQAPQLTLWRVEPGESFEAAWARIAASFDSYPDRIVSVGPRGGMRVAAA